MNERIVIITGSSPIDASVIRRLPRSEIVLAVDSGLDHALAAGLRPSHLIGDLDSVSEVSLAWAARHADISRHPTDKDQTDTELALALAVTFDPEQITLVGGGDRLDHSFAAIGALGALTLTSVPVLDAWWEGQHVRVLHGPGSATLRLVGGSVLSLLALHGPCRNVGLHGVRWELEHFDLDPLVGVGVSNEVHAADGATAAEVTVSLSGGVLTIFDEPDPAAEPAGDATADAVQEETTDAP